MMQPGAFNIPFRIMVLSLALGLTGVVMVYSSSANYAARHQRRVMAKQLGEQALQDYHVYHSPKLAKRQFVWLIMGFVAMMIAYRVDYHWLRRLGPGLLILSLLMLIACYIPGVQRPLFGHHRWIRLGPVAVQPSEFAKLALIIYMARMLHDHHDKMRSLVHGVFPALALTGVFALLIVAEPDIGATAVTVSIVFIMWFIGGMRILHLTSLVGATIPAFVWVVFQYPDRVERVLAFLNPTPEALLGKGMQLHQSLIAVGSGGLTGVGLGNSMQKFFLTEQYSDFIFAIIAEEIGLFGSALIIFAFFLLIWEGWRVAMRAPDFYATLLAAGITLMLAINVTLNLMVVLGLAPTKGLALPFLSLGGSNMLIIMAAMGILMNIGAYIEREGLEQLPKGRTRRKKRTRSRANA